VLIAIGQLLLLTIEAQLEKIDKTIMIANDFNNNFIIFSF